MYTGNGKFRSGDEVKNEFEGLDKIYDFAIERNIREADLEN